MTVGENLHVQVTFHAGASGGGSVVFLTPSFWGGKRVHGISFVHRSFPDRAVQVKADRELRSGASFPMNGTFSANVLKAMQVFVDVRSDLNPSMIVPYPIKISNPEAPNSCLRILLRDGVFRGEWGPASSQLTWYTAPEFTKQTMSSEELQRVLQQLSETGEVIDEAGYEGGDERETT